MIDTLVLNSSDIKGNEKIKNGKNEDTDMAGGNFNTFGEHAKSSLADLEEGDSSSGPVVLASSTKLIE